jgi:uncharacterized protein YlaI
VEDLLDQNMFFNSNFNIFDVSEEKMPKNPVFETKKLQTKPKKQFFCPEQKRRNEHQKSQTNKFLIGSCT